MILTMVSESLLPQRVHYAQSRLEAAPTLPLAGSQERLPAANSKLHGKTSHGFDAGHNFMGQQ